MNKNLFRFYMFFIITFFILINAFPDIFININNSINYIKVKIVMALEKEKNYMVNIYKNKGNIILMLDDGWKSQYTVGYNYMNKKKMRGSVAIIPKLVGEYNYMNKSNLYILYNHGWDLLNHTYSHALLNKKSVDKQINEINKADIWLYENGFTNQNKILIYPEGVYDKNTVKAMKQLNYIGGRSTDDGFNAKIPANLYNIKVKNVFSNINPDDVYDWINYVIENNLTLILLFHKLEDNIDKTLMIYKTNYFYKIIDYIDKRRNDLNIITYSDWVQTILINNQKMISY